MEKQIFVTESISQVAATDLEGVGTLRWVGDNLYRWVKNTDDGDFTIGQVCYHKAAEGADAFEEIFDLSEAGAANASFMAGIVMATTLVYYDATDLTKKCFGWIQVFGNCETVSMYASGGTNIVAGDYLKGDAGGAYVLFDEGYAEVATLTNSMGGAATTTLAAYTAISQGVLTDNGGGTTATVIATATAMTQNAMVDQTGGTAGLTIVALSASGSYLEADAVAMKDGFASIIAQLALIKTDVAALQTEHVNDAASLAARINEIKLDVAATRTADANAIAQIVASINALSVKSRHDKNVVAMEGLTTGIEIATAKRGFVNCIG